jgi:hypothetical protein
MVSAFSTIPRSSFSGDILGAGKGHDVCCAAGSGPAFYIVQLALQECRE